MKELKLNKKSKKFLKISEEILNKAVSIPITVKRDSNVTHKIYKALKEVEGKMSALKKAVDS